MTTRNTWSCDAALLAMILAGMAGCASGPTAPTPPATTTQPAKTTTATPTVPTAPGEADVNCEITGEGEMRYLALGDSYTIGESVAAPESWPYQLVERLYAAGVDVAAPEIIARTGWTTAALAAAIDEANPQGPYDLVTLLIGVNNQYRGLSAEFYRVDFADLLQRAIDFAGGDQRRVIVLSIPDWGATPLAEGQDRTRISAEIERFNTINYEETSIRRAHYVDVTTVSRRTIEEPDLVSADGLHPSGMLYAEWVELIFPVACQALGVGG